MPAPRRRPGQDDRAHMLQIAEDLARAHRLLVRAVDRLAGPQPPAPPDAEPSAKVPAEVPAKLPATSATDAASDFAGLGELELALLGAATSEECSRKSLIRRIGRKPTSCCYAAVR